MLMNSTHNSFCEHVVKIMAIVFGDLCVTVSRSLQEHRKEFSIICLAPSCVYFVCLRNHFASYHTSAFLVLYCSNCKIFFLCFVHASFPLIRCTFCLPFVSYLVALLLSRLHMPRTVWHGAKMFVIHSVFDGHGSKIANIRS